MPANHQAPVRIPIDFARGRRAGKAVERKAGLGIGHGEGLFGLGRLCVQLDRRGLFDRTRVGSKRRSVRNGRSGWTDLPRVHGVWPGYNRARPGGSDGSTNALVGGCISQREWFVACPVSEDLKLELVGRRLKPYVSPHQRVERQAGCAFLCQMVRPIAIS